MPLKLNVGLSKKVGLPDYGSVGATCHLELELDGTLLAGDLDGFHQQARRAYVACAQAVNDELARHAGNAGNSSGPSDVDADGAAHQPASRSPRNNGNGNSSYTNHNSQGNGSSNHRASQKQVDYLHQLARQIDGLGLRRLESLCQKLHGKPTAELTSLDASSLIDTLKAIKDGRLSLASALDGAPS